MMPSPDIHRTLAPDAPIAVLDSGIGGLSILRALCEVLPQERFIYFADSAYTPYGERSPEWIEARVLAVAEELLTGGVVKALVVACNTATLAAIGALRGRYPNLPIVGTEPGVKPAVAASRTGVVAIWATRRTVESARLAQLCAQYPQTRFLPLACDGLAEAIEHYGAGQGADAVHELLAQYAQQGRGRADVLVLGCTHYPLIAPWIATACPELQLLETASPVARQTARVLGAAGVLRADRSDTPIGDGLGVLEWRSSGSLAALMAAVQLFTPQLLAPKLLGDARAGERESRKITA